MRCPLPAANPSKPTGEDLCRCHVPGNSPAFQTKTRHRLVVLTFWLQRSLLTPEYLHTRVYNNASRVSPRTAKNDAIPRLGTTHYVTFLFSEWSVYCIIPYGLLSRILGIGSPLHHLNLVSI